MRQISLIVHDIRSCHNVGSLLRTAEGLGVEHVYLTGYTPYPLRLDDPRLPHISAKLHKQIQKTALGAERYVKWSQHDAVETVLEQLKNKDYRCIALEQSAESIELAAYRPPDKIAIILGREVEGIAPEVLIMSDETIEIPMYGRKESFNVVQAAAMALYHCRFSP